MKFIAIVIICLLPGLTATAQSYFKLFTEKKPQGCIIYASNAAFCPVSVSISLTLDNMVFSEGNKTITLVPADTARYKIGELTAVNAGRGYKFSYKYNYNLGDVALESYDTGYVYDLPYRTGKSFLLFQGYNGSFSHQNENALDFAMPEGTEVLAARDGIVAMVVQSNTQNCMDADCRKYNNYVSICHSDGTIADYVHLRYNGAAVKPGDKVKKGDLIAYSGNTGWSSGPHLHFVCGLPGFNNRRSVKTLFKLGDAVAAYLNEKEIYLRAY